jgi:hypothetical protein
MTSQTSAKWSLDSCEAITRANYPSLVLRGGLWASIIRGGGVVRGEGMEVKWWLGNIPR